MKETATHVFFTSSPSEFLSPHYNSTFEYSDRIYNTAYQFTYASKALLCKDIASFLQILACRDPATLEELGRKIRAKEEVWEQNREEMCVLGTYLKFDSNEELRKKLVETGEKILVFGDLDEIWGIGLKEGDEDIEDGGKWKGQNLMGKCLMRVRQELREEDERAKNAAS